MQTIRGRLTVWYSAALVLTLAAFAIVLYVARRRASYEDLDQRIRSDAELSAAILGESYRARGALVTYDSTGKPALLSDIKAVLEAVPDYLLITAQDGEILYSSSNASLTYQQVVQLRRLMTPPLSGRTGGTVRLEPDGPELRYVAHIVSGAGPRFGSDRKSTRLNSSHLGTSYAVFCLKKKNCWYYASQRRIRKSKRCISQEDCEYEPCCHCCFFPQGVHWHPGGISQSW